MFTDSTPAATVLPVTNSETLQARCSYYRSCGIDAIVRPDVRRIFVLANSRLGAVILPSQLAPQVRRKLSESGLAFGPTGSHPRSGRWTVMVRPDIDETTATYAGLFRRYVSVVRGGGEIALPTPKGEREVDRHWISSPTDLLPPGSAVVHAIKLCAELSPRR
ncbi:DNA-directed RNA polymerase subunit beta [Nocardia sp. NPDC058518]|uniref:DNA-directed RNA polymerase subunit beta n=1 Tax=Nocardia sp. NPDC058518 TaxID=3346534 RepID=UPI00364EF61A